MAERRAIIVASAGLTFILAATGLLGETRSGRSGVGHPVAGVVALIDASAPADDIFNGQFCGGTLVAPDQVMTAAHCVADKTVGRIDVVVGADSLCRGRPIDGERVGIRGIGTHPRYDAESAEFDLAILSLKRRFAEGVHAVGSASAVEPEVGAVALGWGRASLGGVPACRLARVAIDMLEASECAASIGAMGGRAFDAQSMVCAMAAVGAADTCVGDSGGPVLIGSNLDEAVLVGVTSWGHGCGTSNPAVYADPTTWPSLTASKPRP